MNHSRLPDVTTTGNDINYCFYVSPQFLQCGKPWALVHYFATMSSIPNAFIRNAYSKAVSSHRMKRPPSPKWPLCILVLRTTDLEQDGHVTSLTFETHLAASQTPTLSNKKEILAIQKKTNSTQLETSTTMLWSENFTWNRNKLSKLQYRKSTMK